MAISPREVRATKKQEIKTRNETLLWQTWHLLRPPCGRSRIKFCMGGGPRW